MRNFMLIVLLLVQGLAFGRGRRDAAPQKMPMYFIENKGQILDQNGQPRKDIDYALSSPDMTVFAGKGQLHYQYVQKRPEGSSVRPAGGRYQVALSPYELFRLDVELVGCNTAATITTEGQRSEKYHYYTRGDSGITGVGAFQKIIYHDIYPGIDWVIYVSGQKMKYDFIVREGGKAEAIKMKYTGASALSVNDDGSLNISFPGGKITEDAPYSYQEQRKKKVTSSYQLNGNVVSFKVAAVKGTLVIDPGVSWSTYFGGSGLETAFDVTCDKDGYIYIAGLTESISGIATTGAHQTVYGGGIYDNFLAKFDSTGALLWATYYGGGGTTDFLSGLDLYSSVACDRFGHVYLAGMTLSEDHIATAGSFQSALSPLPSGLDNSNGYLVQFNSSGTRNWATYYGASAHYTLFFDVACDGLGNVYAVGQSDSTSSATHQVASTGAYQVQCAGQADALLVKFDMNGNRLWATYYGGQGREIGYSVACDSLGEVYIGGSSSVESTTGIATAGAFQTTPSTLPMDIGFVAKFSPSGSRIWGTYINATVSGVTLDRFNHIYATGVTSTQGAVIDIATPGAWMSAPAYSTASNLGFLMQLNATTCSRDWGTFYGAERSVYQGSVACNNKGDVYYLAHTNGYDPVGVHAISSGNSYQDTLCSPPGLMNPNNDALLAQFDTLGHRKWATYFGGAGSESGMMVTCAPAGDIYTLLQTNSSSHIATAGSQQSVIGGAEDAALIRWLPIDIAIGSRVSPEHDTACAEQTPIAVSIQNKGRMDKTDTLFATLEYVGPISGSVDTFFTGTIAAGATQTFGVGNADFSVSGSYALTVYLHHTRNDHNLDNDTLHFNLEATNIQPDAAITWSQVGTVFHFSKTNPQTGETYLWDFGDGQTSTDAAPQHQYAQTDSFLVTLVVSNYCGSDTARVKIKGIGTGAGINDPALTYGIALYPNPASAGLQLAVPSGIRIEAYKIMDISGRILRSSKYSLPLIDLRSLAEGNYILELNTNRGRACLKFSKSGT